MDGGKACEVDGCGARHYSRGVCSSHYWALPDVRAADNARHRARWAADPELRARRIAQRLALQAAANAVRPGYIPQAEREAAAAKRGCSVADCSRRHFGRGMCLMHYKRDRRARGLDGGVGRAWVEVGASTPRGPRVVRVLTLIGHGRIGAQPKCLHCDNMMVGLSTARWQCPISDIVITINEDELTAALVARGEDVL